MRTLSVVVALLAMACAPDPVDSSRDGGNPTGDGGSNGERDGGARSDGGSTDEDGGSAVEDGGGEIRCMNDPSRPCGADGFCDYDAECGESGDPMGTCRPNPASCEAVCEPVCGCNGVTYINECEANRAGTDVQGEGACDCGAQDATGTGACDVPLGYKWNGSTCIELRGCTCEGADCDHLRNYPDCQAHAETCEGGTCV